jgi:orotidine-5'-phosphate decarboxylase
MTENQVLAAAAERILVPIDTGDLDTALDMAQRVAEAGAGVKLGLEFYVANGPDAANQVAGWTPLFLDLKFHDIPNTVAGAIWSAVTSTAPMILNVHASGGRAMMEAAVDANKRAAQAAQIPTPMLIAVTVLTSLDDADLEAVGQQGHAGDQAVRLAQLAQASGCDGVVCSAHEIAAIRAACGPKFSLIVPGIRPKTAASDDQKRVMTPGDAIRAGADYLVIGRPITQADDPTAATHAIAVEIAEAFAETAA